MNAIQAQGSTRRSVVLGGTAIVGAALAAACRAGDATPATSRSSAPVTITYLSPNNQERLQRHRQTFEAFTQEHPNIKVEINPLPQGQTWDVAMQVRHQGGDPADTMEIVTYWHHLHPAGVPLDLTPLMRRSRIDQGRFVSEPIGNFTVDGKLYGLPISLSVDSFAYNLDLLERHGLKPPPANPDDRSWTMETFFEYAQKLTRPGEQWGYSGRHSGGGAFYHDGTFFGMGVWDEKARKMTVDTPEFRRGLEFWRDLESRYRFQPTTQEARELGPNVDATFLSGKVGIHNVYIGITPQFRWGLATLPFSGRGRNVAGRMGLHALALGKGKYQDQAWTFVSWFAQPANAGRYVAGMGHAVSPLLDEKASDLPQREWRETYRVDPKALLLQARYSKRARWGISTLNGWDQVDREITALNTRYRSGQISTDEIVREVHRLGTAAIAATPVK